jgi:hypothetical protein
MTRSRTSYLPGKYKSSPLSSRLTCPECPSRHFSNKAALTRHWNYAHQPTQGDSLGSSSVSPIFAPSPALYDQAAYYGLSDALDDLAENYNDAIVRDLGSDLSDSELDVHPINRSWTRRKHPLLNGTVDMPFC